MSSRRRTVVFAISVDLLVCDERKHRHRTRALDRLSDAALVLRGYARDAARHDLAAFRHELPKKVDIFPIDIVGHHLTRTATLIAARAITDDVLSYAKGGLIHHFHFFLCHNLLAS